jgi:myo-inositol-1(or 4)-monophosphatase
MTTTEIAARAETAKRLAREAGALARRYFRREIPFTAEAKGPQDFVSAADHAVEALIRERLTREFPTDDILA